MDPYAFLYASRDFFRRILLGVITWGWIPNTSCIASSPCKAIVIYCLRTRNSISTFKKVREINFNFSFAHLIYPSCLPQLSHAFVISFIFPSFSCEMGFTPVIAFKAQNQCPGFFTISFRIRGIASLPIPIIC